MSFNSLLKLLLKLSHQVSWDSSSSEMNFNWQQLDFRSTIPGRSFLVQNRFKFNWKGLFCAEIRVFLWWKSQEELNQGNLSLTKDPPCFAVWSPSTKSSPSVVKMEQAVPLLRNEEQFMGCWTGGKQLPPVVNSPPGNEIERAHILSTAIQPVRKFDSIYLIFDQEYISFCLCDRPGSGLLIIPLRTCHLRCW